jgi:DNA-binding MarR family transcriptional regulator
MDDYLDDGLRLAVMRLARRMRLERSVKDLRDHQLSVLFTLLREGPITIGKLGELERISAPSITRTVNLMVKSGYLVRSAAEEDGRLVVVNVSDAGQKIASEVRRRRAAWFSEALRELSDEDRDLLKSAIQILQRVTDS